MNSAGQRTGQFKVTFSEKCILLFMVYDEPNKVIIANSCGENILLQC